MIRLPAVGALLALVATLALGACSRTPSTQQSLAGCLGHGAGGFSKHGQHELVYAIRYDSAGPQLDAAVVVRALPSWRRRSAPDSQPRSWRVAGGRRLINGATAGPLWIGHERATNTVWLDSLPVPLGADNVLLLDVGSDDAPRIIGRARVEPRLPAGAASCSPPRTRDESEAFEQSLWTVVSRASQVREFLDR